MLTILTRSSHELVCTRSTQTQNNAARRTADSVDDLRFTALQVVAAAVVAGAVMCQYNVRQATDRDMRLYCYWNSYAQAGSESMECTVVEG